MIATPESVIEEAIRLQQIPAPTFAEGARADYVAERFARAGLHNVATDALHNVFGRVPGREPGLGVAITAHLDTVFAADTDLRLRRDGNLLFGPGIADNSLGVAGLLAQIAPLQAQPPRRDVWLVANSGEEGLGNLCGMRAAMAQLRQRLGAVLVLEGGAFGVVIHRGIGVERRRLTVETAGGHSWSDFGSPSAIHELCQIGAAIAAISLPEQPRSSFNLGTIEGGTGVNSIAAHASALLDLRSEEPAALGALAASVDQLLARRRREGVVVESERIGERPAGGIPTDHPLVRAAIAALNAVGCTEPRLRAASTDANVPLALGIPALCIGLAEGYNAHRLDEYVDLHWLPAGLEQCQHLLHSTLQWLP